MSAAHECAPCRHPPSSAVRALVAAGCRAACATPRYASVRGQSPATAPRTGYPTAGRRSPHIRRVASRRPRSAAPDRRLPPAARAAASLLARALGGPALLAAVAAWVAALAIGRVPAPLHRFLAAFVRETAHVSAFLHLVGRPYPGFVGREGSYPVDLTIAPPARQRRLGVLARVVARAPGAPPRRGVRARRAGRRGARLVRRARHRPHARRAARSRRGRAALPGADGGVRPAPDGAVPGRVTDGSSRADRGRADDAPRVRRAVASPARWPSRWVVAAWLLVRRRPSRATCAADGRRRRGVRRGARRARGALRALPLRGLGARARSALLVDARRLRAAGRPASPASRPPGRSAPGCCSGCSGSRSPGSCGSRSPSPALWWERRHGALARSGTSTSSSAAGSGSAGRSSRSRSRSLVVMALARWLGSWWWLPGALALAVDRRRARARRAVPHHGPRARPTTSGSSARTSALPARAGRRAASRCASRR